MTAVPTSEQSQPMSRAARRALRDGIPLGGTDTAPLLPFAVGGTWVLAILLTVAAYADPLVLVGVNLLVGVIVALGWPRLLGTATPRATSVILLAVALGAAAASLVDDDPYLRWTPLVIAGGLVLTFVWQLARRDGRLGLTGSVAATLFGVAVITLATVLNPLARTLHGTDIVAVTMASIALGAVADLLTGRPKFHVWMLPAAMLLGGWAAAATSFFLGNPAPGQGLLIGVLAAAVSHATRRILGVLPGAQTRLGQLTVAASSVSLVAVVAYVLARIFVG